MSEQCERMLLVQAKTGDRAAFDRLQKLLETPLRHFVRRLIGTNDAEEDILRSTFLALYMNVERIEPVENLRPFLFRVVRNLCYKELRRKGRFQTVSLDARSEDGSPTCVELKDSRPPPDEQVAWMLLMGEVQQAMERLPEIQRQTMILYCEMNLTYEQIAAATACDIGTVKSRLFYARKNLARLLRSDVVEALGLDREKSRVGNKR